MNSTAFIWNYFHQLHLDTQSDEIKDSTFIHTQCDPQVLGLLFFLITVLELPISQPTKFYQPTSVHTPRFVYLRQSTRYNWSCGVSFFNTSWMAEMNRELPLNFVWKTVYLWQKHWYWCKRPVGLRLWTDQTFFCWYSRFWDRRELVEGDERGGRPKSTRTW